jgi:cytochrome c oxidase subunit II
VIVCTLAVGGLLSGCGRQSILSRGSPQTHDITLLWWWMLAAATIVFVGAVAMLGVAWRRRSTAGLPIFGEREDLNKRLVLLFGILIPLVTLLALFAVANIYLIGESAPPAAASTSMTVDVIAHQWWWEIRYPGSQAVTANEIHIPTGTRVNVVASTGDVIHSFWVPQLARKIDTVPGRQNRILMYASHAGTYRGQCAEFCGLQHAHMGLEVVAQPPAAFRAWLSRMAQPATATGGQGQVGRQLFMTDQCASCHQIRGTSASATVGPDLTHVASRSTLAALTIPNDPAHLAAWIANPQAIKPGDRMPDLGLSRREVQAIVAYLDSLH